MYRFFRKWVFVCFYLTMSTEHTLTREPDAFVTTLIFRYISKVIPYGFTPQEFIRVCQICRENCRLKGCIARFRGCWRLSGEFKLERLARITVFLFRAGDNEERIHFLQKIRLRRKKYISCMKLLDGRTCRDLD